MKGARGLGSTESMGLWAVLAVNILGRLVLVLAVNILDLEVFSIWYCDALLDALTMVMTPLIIYPISNQISLCTGNLFGLRLFLLCLGFLDLSFQNCYHSPQTQPILGTNRN
jgi:hypothetical protein